MSFFTVDQITDSVSSLANYLAEQNGGDSEQYSSLISDWMNARAAPKPKAAAKGKVEPAASKAKPKSVPKVEEPEASEEESPKPAKAKAKAKSKSASKVEEPEVEEPKPAAKAKAKAKGAPKVEEPEVEEPKPAAKAKAKAKGAPKVEEPEVEEPKPVAKAKAKSVPEPKAKATCDRSIKTATGGYRVCGSPVAEGETKCGPCLRLAKTKETAPPAPREPAPKSARVVKQPVVRMIEVSEGDFAGKLYNPETGICFDPDQGKGACGVFAPFEEEGEVMTDEEGNTVFSFDDLYPLEQDHLDMIKKWGIPQVHLEGDPEEDVEEEDDGEAINEDEDEDE